MTNPQAGWYPDPSGDTSQQRYWDGTQWTNDFAPAQAQNPQPGVVVQETRYYGADGSQTTVDQVYYQPQTVNSSEQNMRLVAFIFCIISTISVCWAIIPMAWMVPMTVHTWGIYKGTKANTTAFGVCTLLFVSLIGGIFLLISKKDQ